jgi:uncharacterized membrane protein
VNSSAAASLGLADDLPAAAVAGALALALASLILLAIELRAGGARRGLVFASGLVATLALTLAVLRPTWVRVHGTASPARVVVLVDGSERLELPAGDGRSRRALAEEKARELASRWPDVRLELLRFGEGPVRPLAGAAARTPWVESDLAGALEQVIGASSERPDAVVVLSDGRFTRPTELRESASRDALARRAQGVPLHTLSVADSAPADRSLRVVSATGVAVAHQPLRLHVELGCEPEASCAGATVIVRELLEGRPAVELARGTPAVQGDAEVAELEVTLERAGERVLEVELDAAPDVLPENDVRRLPIRVRRDRTRVLHVAGRPSYDVRALRGFLKSDASIDLVSFFILRTRSDDVRAEDSELALIPFPVEELFTEHLPSFDAVVLQDIDARLYDLTEHFIALRDYVARGGGLILVGGPSGFADGGYADSALEEALPVELEAVAGSPSLARVVPRYTAAGRAAPMLRALRGGLGESLPEMPGANLLGRPRPSALVLWEHPVLTAADGPGVVPMPLLALGEYGDGRSLALALDGTHLLGFGPLGARTGGEGHSALWEGLLGWLMRDPRYEVAQAELEGACLVGRTTHLSVTLLPGASAPMRVEVTPLALERGPSTIVLPRAEPRAGRERFVVEGLEPGGYAARITVGSAPPARYVFACERGGLAWADSRPDPDRLQAIAAATGGTHRAAAAPAELPAPPRKWILAERSVRPLLPPWAWSSLAALALGLHWVTRRLSGLR